MCQPISTMSETRRRVTYTQLLHLWEFLNKHREVAVGFNKSAQAREHSKMMWQKAADLLNSIGEGSVKTGPEWSKYWVDYKAKLKRKNRLINDASTRTGGGPATELEFSEMDRKFLSILGEDLGLGLPGIRVEPLVTQEHRAVDWDTNRPGTSQSTLATIDEETLYLDVGFSENENQSDPVHVPHTSAQQAPSQQERMSVQDSPSSNVAEHASLSMSGQQQDQQSTSSTQANQNIASTQAPRTEPPSRRQRRRRRRMTAADAREQLVTAAETRAQAELTNSRSIQQAIGVLRDMVPILRRMEARLPGEAPTTE